MTYVDHAGQTFWLGRDNDAPHDDRNREFPARAATGPLKPVAWRRRGATLLQRVGSCTGNALTYALNSEPRWTPGSPIRGESDAEAFYSAGTRLDGFKGVWPPTDTGCTGPAVCRAARNEGLLTGYTHAFGIDHLLGALQVGTVMVGTIWLRAMFTPDADGLVTPTGDDVVGGHEYHARLFNPTRGKRGAVGFDQSWGDDWGTRDVYGSTGVWWMLVEHVDWLLRQHGDVTVPIARVA